MLGVCCTAVGFECSAGRGFDKKSAQKKPTSVHREPAGRDFLEEPPKAQKDARCWREAQDLPEFVLHELKIGQRAAAQRVCPAAGMMGNYCDCLVFG